MRDGCIGRASQEEQLRLRLHELGLPLNGRRSDDISLRKLCQAMDISLQHPSGDRKGRDELVEALVSALLPEVPVLTFGSDHSLKKHVVTFVTSALRICHMPVIV